MLLIMDVIACHFDWSEEILREYRNNKISPFSRNDNIKNPDIKC
jgi:hypothetical protein